MKIGSVMACLALALAGCLPEGGGRNGDGNLPDAAAPLCEVSPVCPAGTSFYWTWVTDDGGVIEQTSDRPSTDHWLSHIACIQTGADPYMTEASRSFLFEGFYIDVGGAERFSDDALPGGPLVAIDTASGTGSSLAGDAVLCAPGQDRAYERRFYNSSGQLTRTEEWPENNPDGYSPPEP